MIKAHRYNYKEIRAQALSPTATASERKELVYWFQQFANGCYWNGECFDMDEGLSLYPVYKEVLDEDGELYDLELIDAEIR